jgi:transaldolase
MKFFADTAEVKEIKELAGLGLLDGVTTNPSLVAKSGRQFKDVIAEICATVEGPVSAEVVSLDYDGMMREAADLRKIARNVAIKVPLTLDNAVLLRQSGIACRKGGGQLHLALYRPSR